MANRSTYKQRSRPKFKVRTRSHLIQLGHTTKIMGILNATPDSFSKDGRYKKSLNSSSAVRYACKLIRQGADMIDIGGESTRPGAERISVKEELGRIIPVIQQLSQKTDVPISVDTYKSTVAKEALEAGASIVNNIMGNKINMHLLRTVKKYDAAIVLMHIRGTPRTMQKNIHYDRLIPDIISSLEKSIENCLENGIKSDKIIIDPGIGFGKTVAHNLKIINRLESFRTLKYPLLVGTSRKSFIGKVLNREVHQRLPGTIASVCASITNGVHIVRVHDVAPVKDATVMMDAIINEKKLNDHV